MSSWKFEGFPGSYGRFMWISFVSLMCIRMNCLDTFYWSIYLSQITTFIYQIFHQVGSVARSSLIYDLFLDLASYSSATLLSLGQGFFTCLRTPRFVMSIPQHGVVSYWTDSSKYFLFWSSLKLLGWQRDLWIIILWLSRNHLPQPRSSHCLGLFWLLRFLARSTSYYGGICVFV